MLKHIAVSETEKLNWFPAEGSLSDTFTPHQFLELPPIDWNKDIKILQGSYCQAFTERMIKKDLKQRTLDTLFLTPMKNKQGSYVMLNLATNKEITSTHITQVPITDLVIQTVKELAAQDGMTPLKIENRTRTMIYNNDMLPGIITRKTPNQLLLTTTPPMFLGSNNPTTMSLAMSTTTLQSLRLNLTTSGPTPMISFQLASPAAEPRLMLVMLLSQLPLDNPRRLLPLQPVRAGVHTPSLASPLHTTRC